MVEEMRVTVNGREEMRPIEYFAKGIAYPKTYGNEIVHQSATGIPDIRKSVVKDEIDTNDSGYGL